MLKFLLLAASAPPITLLQTSDLHANVAAYDYVSARPDAARGLAKAATIIKRRRTPCTLVIDTGDAIQGAPLPPEAVIAAMKVVGYDAISLGNHDFDFPASQRAFPFPVLFNSSLVKSVCGVRVGVIGLITPKTREWAAFASEKPPSTEIDFESRFDNPIDVAKRELRALQADFKVIAIHDDEATMRAVAALPGVDAVLWGHEHRPYAEKTVTQPGKWGSHVAEITLGQGSKLWPVDGVVEDPSVLEAIKPWHDKTIAAMDALVGNTELTGAALVNAAQRKAAKDAGVAVDRSCTVRATSPKTLRERDLRQLLPYENTLVVMETNAGDEVCEGQGSRVALNNYQASQVKGGKVIWKSRQTIRDMVRAYVRVLH